MKCKKSLISCHKAPNLWAILLILMIGILSGCQEKPETADNVREAQTGKLKLQVEAAQESLDFHASQLGEQYNGTICYDGVSNVCIVINGKVLPLEQAIQENVCSVEEITAWAQEDSRNGLCVEGQCTYNGLTKFTYTYPEYMLIVIHDVYETPDGNEYIINRFTVTLPKELKPSPIGYSDADTGEYLDLEDWGITFTPQSVTRSGITLETVQHDGQNFGALYLTDFYLVSEPQKALLEESQTYGLLLPIVMDGTGELNLEWNTALSSGSYTLVVRLEEQYNKEYVPSLMRNYHDTQQYLIPIAIP